MITIKKDLAVSGLIFEVCPLNTTKQLSTILKRMLYDMYWGLLRLNKNFALQHCQDGLFHNA